MNGVRQPFAHPALGAPYTALPSGIGNPPPGYMPYNGGPGFVEQSSEHVERENSFKRDKPSNKAQEDCTMHEWQPYHGFTEVYQYCIHCDLKRWPKKHD